MNTVSNNFENYFDYLSERSITASVADIAIQGIGIGFIAHGLNSLLQACSSDYSSLRNRIGHYFHLKPVSHQKLTSNKRMLVGIVSIIGGIALLGSNYSISHLKPVFLQHLHQREKDVLDIFGNEMITFNPYDSQSKALFLSSSFGDQNPMKIETDAWYNLQNLDNLISKAERDYHGNRGSLVALSNSHDVRYKVISSVDEMCAEIAAAAKIGKLKTLVLNMHGSPYTMYLPGMEVVLNGKFQGIPSDCFAGLDQEAEITLLSCQSGASPDGVAYAIATAAQRIVWAPTVNIGSQVFWDGIPARPSFFSYATVIDCFVKTQGITSAFISALKAELYSGITCKFSPDGSRECK